MSVTDDEMKVLQDRLLYLSQKLDEYQTKKKSKKRENAELDIGYDKFIKVKNQIIEENDRYLQALNKNAKSFSSSVTCVRTFCDSAQELICGKENQRSISSLNEGANKIKKQILDNDDSIEILNKKIVQIKAEINDIRMQLNNLGG